MWATAWATPRGLSPSTTPARAAPTPSATPLSGHAVASFLLGTPNSGSVDKNVATAFQNLFYGAYIQDDFRPTPKLTINMGFRWEYEGPRTERYNQMTRGFAYDTPSPLQSAAPNLQREWRPAVRRIPAASRAGRPTPVWKNFSPRLGIAYELHPKLSCAPGTASSSPAPPTPAAAPALLPASASPRPWSPALDGVNPDRPAEQSLPIRTAAPHRHVARASDAGRPGSAVHRGVAPHHLFAAVQLRPAVLAASPTC